MPSLIENIQQYVLTHIEIAKIETQEKIQAAVRQVLILMLLACCVMMASAFGLVALALWINQLTQSLYIGFLVVALLFVMGAVFAFMAWKKHNNSNE